MERALEEAAPDLLGMDVEGAVRSRGDGKPLPLAPAANGRPSRARGWPVLDGVDDLARGRAARRSRWPASALVVANVEGELLAYHDRVRGLRRAARRRPT